MDKIMTLTKAQLRKLGPCAMAPYEHLFPTARARDAERLKDKVDGLTADLRSAVEVAFRRGATEWVRLNYPADFKRLSALNEGAE